MAYDFSGVRLISTSEKYAECDYDVGFYSIGYEKRSNFIANNLVDRTKALCGLEYEEFLGGAFDYNREWSRSAGAHIVAASGYRLDRDGQFKADIEEIIERSKPKEGPIRIWIDVSSFDRSLMARMLHVLMEVIPSPFLLRILYAPAKFVEPSFSFAPVRDCSPVIPELSGALGRPDREIKLILGLGYEFGVALGLIQQFEPDIAFAFTPKGHDKRYEPAVAKANFEFDFGTEQVRTITYMVDQPVLTFDRLLALTSDVSPSRSVIIVPNGPKIFAAASILVGLLRKPYVSILRTSHSNGVPAHEIEASGHVFAMDLVR